MKAPENLAVVALAVLLAVCLLGYYSTRESATPSLPQRDAAAAQPFVDRNLLVAAMQLAPSAATREEQAQAREAWRWAGHELDLAFAAALRELSDNIAKLKDRVTADKKRVEDLGKDGGDQLELAQAQLDLDQDELDDAQSDLPRLREQGEASGKEADQTLKFGQPAPTGTLLDQLREWFSLSGYHGQLQAAHRLASDHAGRLLAEHKALEAQLASPGSDSTVAALQKLAEQRKTLAGLDQRKRDANHLVAVYQSWGALVENRLRAVRRLALRSLAAIIAILLVALLLNRAMNRILRELGRQWFGQVRVIARTVLRAVAVLLILLIVFGLPAQLSALVGIVTALMPLFRARVNRKRTPVKILLGNRKARKAGLTVPRAMSSKSGH